MHREAFLYFLLTVMVLASPAVAGGGFYFDRAAFDVAVPGLFYDAFVSYYASVAPVGGLINSLVYPAGSFFTSDTVPLIDSGIASAAPMNFNNGIIEAVDATDYLGALFLNGAASAAGFYVEATGRLPSSYNYLYSEAAFPIGSASYQSRFTDGQFVGYFQSVQDLSSLYMRVVSYDNIEIIFTPVYSGISHLVLEARYLSSGGDPHIKSSVIDAILPGLAPSDHVNLFAHPLLTANAQLRSFEFLDFDHATYYGAVGVQVANGDRIVVEAYEADDGTPAFLVTINGESLARHSAVTVEAGSASYEVHYDNHGSVPNGRDLSIFHRDYPYMHHDALVRVHMAGVAAIDIDLAWKDAFVDWNQATPEVYREAGAFLNVAVRDLEQESTSKAAGLLKATDRMQRLKLAVDSKISHDEEAGDWESHRRSVEAMEQLDSMLVQVVTEHKVDSLF